MTPIWTTHDISRLCGLESTGPDRPISGFSIDTRSLKPGEVFVALSGRHADGHDYVDHALAAGAVAALLARPLGKGPEWVVTDTLEALRQIAIAARARSAARFFAITGSVGKTGTRAMLERALSDYAPTHASIKSYNNHFGVPLSLANMPQEAEYGVFEIGMSHAGEITPLSEMVHPDIGIITAIEAQHIENFDGIEGIADAKSEIFAGMGPDGLAILPGDSPHLAQLVDNAKKAGLRHILTFGEGEDCDATLSHVTMDGTSCRGKVRLGTQTYALDLPVMGKHWLKNATAVLLAVHAAGLDIAPAITALKEFQSQPGRGRIITLGPANQHITLIDESYNAAPVAVQAAIGILAQLNAGQTHRRIAVLGDIYELGDRQDQVIEDLRHDLVKNKIDRVHGCGPMTRDLVDALPREMQGVCADDPLALADQIIPTIDPGDIIMIKGSRGPGAKPRMQMLLEHVQGALRARFDTAHCA